MEYNYQVKNNLGELSEGIIDAPSENEAVDILQGRGYVVLALDLAKKSFFKGDLSQIFSRANTKDIVVFTRQLATLLDADMPLAEGLRTMAKQSEKGVFRKTLGEVSDMVEGGSSLFGALEKYPKLFSPFYIKLVRSGELSGKLHESLSYLAEYMERTQSINSKIRGALAYPAFIIFAMIVVTTIMVVYVLPQLLIIFKESGITNLPITTRILIVVTDFVNKYLYAIMVLVIGGGVAFWRFLATEKGKIWADKAKLKAPLFGPILRNLYLARVAESLSTLIKAGISILDALRITSELVDNSLFQTILLDSEENVRGGGNISESFSQSTLIPPLLTSMIAIGERTGKLDFMLGHASKFYRSESENDIQNISQLIEPVLVLVLGAGVAALVASVLLPIYSLVGAG